MLFAGMTKTSQRYKPTTRRMHECKHCGWWYMPKAVDRSQYCSRKCAFAHKKGEHHSRYNGGKRKRDLHPISTALVRWANSWHHCRYCGNIYTGRDTKKICSDECKNNIHYVRYANMRTQCVKCDAPIVQRGPEERKSNGRRHSANKICDACKLISVQDGRRAMKYKRIARKRGGRHESFKHDEVFRRDGWRCQQCRCKVRRFKNTNHPRYPHLDHIVPLSRGGEHTRVNTQCLCRRCNMGKSDQSYGQLRLVG